MNGLNLIKNLISASGLPEELAQKELDRIVLAAGKESDNLTLNDLRELLAEYLQEVLVKANEDFSAEN
jgi:hypothetical protein